MTTQVLHLVGGGPGTVLALRRHFKIALAAIGTPKPLVAYVGTASNDDRGFFAMIAGMVSLAGARMRLAKIASRRARMSEARALLDACDLVFVSGGDVEHGMKVLHERDMAKPLETLARGGKPFFSISAGSLMLARDWVRFPDENDESSAELFPCLGIAPVHVDAHSEEDGWSELRVLMRLLHARGDREPEGYGLTRQGAMRVTVDAAGRALKEAFGTDIPRFVVKSGKVAKGAPLRC